MGTTHFVSIDHAHSILVFRIWIWLARLKKNKDFFIRRLIGPASNALTTPLSLNSTIGISFHAERETEAPSEVSGAHLEGENART